MSLTRKALAGTRVVETEPSKLRGIASGGGKRES